ncbi:unnamed protein product, partial [Bubo scandiacus]
TGSLPCQYGRQKGCVQMCKVAASQNTWCIQKDAILDMVWSGALELLGNYALPGAASQGTSGMSVQVLSIKKALEGNLGATGYRPVHLTSILGEMKMQAPAFCVYGAATCSTCVCTCIALNSASLWVTGDRCGGKRGWENRGRKLSSISLGMIGKR